MTVPRHALPSTVVRHRVSRISQLVDSCDLLLDRLVLVQQRERVGYTRPAIGRVVWSSLLPKSEGQRFDPPLTAQLAAHSRPNAG